MTNEKELREEIRTRLTYATNEDIYDDLERMCNSIVDLLHSHTKEVVEMVESKKKYVLNGEGLPHENSPEIYGNQRIESYRRGYNQALDDLLASLEDNKK